MDIVEFFNPKDSNHLHDYDYLCRNGCWSLWFLEQINIHHIVFSDCWQVGIANKIANQYILEKLYLGK